jgi:hypothetical protein
MNFRHHTPFRDGTDAAADRIDLIKLGGMAIGVGLEKDFVTVLDFLLSRGSFFGARLNGIRREQRATASASF